VLLLFLCVGALADLTGSGGPSPARHAYGGGLAAVAGRDGVRKASAREESAVDRVLAYTPYLSSGGRRHREVALTFDDGPSPYTPRVVRVLRRLHTPATFFEVGEMIDSFPGDARLVRRFFPVGDHTLSHAALGRLPVGQQRTQVLADAARMRMLGDAFPRLFRPPYASFDRWTLAVLRRYRMLMVLWSVDSEDYTRPGTRAIVRNVVSRVRPGGIVLMHDGGGLRDQTIRALPAIVHKLRRRGYRFVTVPQMLVTAPPRRTQKVPVGAPHQ
jgi:peptidoglycan/xylan/chitin deacetylase (PgdA/CDA1 family)